MAAADYDRAYRPYAVPAPAGEYDRPYRNEVVPYGDRRLDIVVKPPTRSPPPPLPVSTSTKSSGGGGVGSAWCFSDPEMKRRRRVASYKAYSVEGKVKASLRRGFRWIKAKCTELIHGWRIQISIAVLQQLLRSFLSNSCEIAQPAIHASVSLRKAGKVQFIFIPRDR
ncbi:hypothetical protein U9M48_007158 [Paspalum notatum var. saurae]|uniref:DUF3511 domain protein n=1 Tax=Paspalum notatum var. saurae TaxID=547442 RepID=A0AAQ3PW35_PASNO